MHDSRKVFLLENEPRCILASYEPCHIGDRWPIDSDKLSELKTFDEDIKVGDFVVVPTGTRHGMTVMKVEYVDDIEPDMNSDKEILWVVGRVDKNTHDKLLADERSFIHAARAAERKREKAKLKEAFLGELDTSKHAIAHQAPEASAEA